MMRSVLPAVLLLHAAAALGQAHGNEWIDYGRRYWKFEVHADGVYRIDSAALAQSGFPLATVDPRHLMLFGHEEEVPLYVHGEGDGAFNSGDYIEFFARKADGQKVDKRMYPFPDACPNPYVSLYNDTIRYFLTWDAAAAPKRFRAYANTDYGAQAPSPWGWHSSVTAFKLIFWAGLLEPWLQQQGIGTSLSAMLESEGFGGPPLFVNAPNAPNIEHTAVVPTPSAYLGPGAPDAFVEATTAAQNNAGNSFWLNHHTQWYLGSSQGPLLLDTVFNGARTVRGRFYLPPAALGPTTTIAFRAPYDLNDPGNPMHVGNYVDNYLDWQALSNVLIRYARTFDAVGAGPLQWEVPATSGPLMRIDFTGFSGTPVVYAEGDSLRRVLPTFDGGAWKCIFPRAPGDQETKVRVFAQEGVQAITALRPATPTGFFTDFAAQQADSAMLIVAHGSLMNGALAYAAYREGSLVNRYSTVVADVDELYDQYGGGIPKHAYAIRAFSRHMLQALPSPPQALFLIGKSINTWQAFFTSLPSINPNVGTNYARCLVPTYGYPSSDQAFTTGLLGDPRRMDIPVGRLSATSNADVFAYLAKVQATEAQPPAIWQKNVLHFAGGFTPGEISGLASSLRFLAAIAADSLMGADTVLFRKLSSSIIAQASADSVRMYIEDRGVSLMTFLAHAFSANFDITIDEPENYQWNGKHPVVLGLSCYIGNIHGNGPPTATEKWVLTPGAGPVAFMAQGDLGYTGLLMGYARPFYESLSRVNHGGSVGKHMQHAGLQSQLPSSHTYLLWNAQNFALQGDPTLTINQHKLPDYTVAPPRILIEPPVVTADLDSFTVKVVVENQGRAVQRTINLELQRTRSNGQVSSHFATLSNVYLRDTAVFRLPTLGFAGGQGPNQLLVKVDLDPNQVPELDDEINNVAGTSLNILGGDIIPVWPYHYAVIPDPQPTLKASTGDPFAPVRTYVFQIDTTDLFNSPVRQTAAIQAPGGVVSWDPPAIFGLNAQQDSLVYFWRCSLDSAATGTGQYNWYERSFQRIADRWGWGQDHFFQFKENAYAGVAYDRPQRDFDFDQSLRTVRARVQGNVPGPSTGWYMELAAVDYGGCGVQPAWHVAVLDPATLEPWATYYVNAQGTVFNPNNQFGNFNNNGMCRNRPEAFFVFQTNSSPQLASMQDMIANAIPDGHHVLLYTWRYLDKDGTEAGNPALPGLLQAAGLPSWSALADSVPYISYFRKGDPGSFRDTIGVSITDDISLTQTIAAAFGIGTITSTDAGPASSWHGLYWDELPLTPTDSTRIKVYGVPPGTSLGVELFDLDSNLDQLTDLGSLVDAQQYPVLRLRAELRDNQPGENARPAQLQRWHLLYAPEPDCAIHPPLGLYAELDGLRESLPAAAAVAVQNISAFDMDSLLIAAWVVDRANNRRLVHYRVNPPLPAGAWVMDTVRFSTLGLPGWNTLIVEANPIDTATGRYHQPEQHHFNNIAQWRFEVQRDIENPILDITFDGRHILDGDIVSARPEIRITLDDENILRLLDSPADTAQFKVFLSRPDGTQQQIRFRDGSGNEIMRFTPASGPDNIARIDYHPRFEQDGQYTLTVFASDLSGNRSGDNDYKVRFEVVNKPTITEVLNYPNPFTTSTRFVFTVTGQEPPTQMKIQIMTITGRVVREVSLAELGPVRVGRNISEFAWDGTDQFGDRLARGVYLYRVLARLHGQELEVRETQASQYFTKGYGKMYLLR